MQQPLSSTFRGHTLIAQGLIENLRHAPDAVGVGSTPLKSFCGAPLTGGESRCDACVLMEHVFIANLPDAWDRRIPFFKAGLLTVASRFFVLSVMKRVEDSVLFARWTAAGTFAHLQHHISIMPKIAVDLSDPTGACFPCCHFCGTQAHNGFPGSICGVCESNVLTRPSVPVGFMKPLSVR